MQAEARMGKTGRLALSDRIRGLLLSDTDFDTSEVRRKGLLPKASVEHGQATLVASGSTNGSNKMVVKPFPFTLPVSKVTSGHDPETEKSIAIVSRALTCAAASCPAVRTYRNLNS